MSSTLWEYVFQKSADKPIPMSQRVLKNNIVPMIYPFLTTKQFSSGRTQTCRPSTRRGIESHQGIPGFQLCPRQGRQLRQLQRLERFRGGRRKAHPHQVASSTGLRRSGGSPDGEEPEVEDELHRGEETRRRSCRPSAQDGGSAFRGQPDDRSEIRASQRGADGHFL